MADPTHLDRLRDGVESSNQWREGRGLREVDATVFTGAILTGTNLHGAVGDAALGLRHGTGWVQEAPGGDGDDTAEGGETLHHGLRHTSGA